MKITLSVSEEKFFRQFDKAYPAPSPFARWIPGDKSSLVGVRRGRAIHLYHRKKGMFSLFSTTLYGYLEPDSSALRYHFSRPRGILLPWVLWCALLLYTGGSILFREPGFALWFLIPGLCLLLPLFLFSKKEKERLEEALFSFTGNEMGQAS